MGVQSEVAHPGPVTETGATISVAPAAAHASRVGVSGPGSRQYSDSHERAPAQQKVKDIWEDTKDVARECVWSDEFGIMVDACGCGQAVTWLEWMSTQRA